MRFWSSLTTVLVLDQFSKYWLSSHLPQGSSRPLLDGFLYLTWYIIGELLSDYSGDGIRFFCSVRP